jgi:hypothetical protein
MMCPLQLHAEFTLCLEGNRILQLKTHTAHRPQEEWLSAAQGRAEQVASTALAQLHMVLLSAVSCHPPYNCRD